MNALIAHQRPCEVQDRDRSFARARLLRQTCTAADLSGTWGTGIGYVATSLRLARTGPITYRVAFASGGCLGSEAAQRTATYRDGVLTFDRPVTEYGGETYRRMRSIRTDLGVRLISEPSIERSLNMAVEVAAVVRQHPEQRAFFNQMFLDTWTLGIQSRRVQVPP